jgi:hypothetical protein
MEAGCLVCEFTSYLQLWRAFGAAVCASSGGWVKGFAICDGGVYACCFAWLLATD